MAKTNADGSKSLGRGDLLAIAIGNVIGGGVMTMTGLAIGITGRSILLSYIICAVMVTIVALPQFFLSGTIRMNGGFYTQAAMFGGKWFAGLYSVVFVSYFFGATMYSASFADYVLSAFPEINGKIVAFAILTIFVVLNLCGIQVAAKVQYLLVIVLVIALLLFTGFGIIHLEPGYFDENQFFTNGFTGVMSAAALLSMATSGATFIINMSREAKNPKKDIPFCIVVGTVIVTILYIGVGVVAAGVFPVEHVAGQNLSKVAREILPTPLYIFFIVGGAMVALVTSLNANLGWLQAPIAQAAEDGWWPKFFAKRNDKFGTPHYIILTIYVLCSVIILSGMNVGDIANIGNTLANCVQVILCLAIITMPKKIPEIWKRSQFHINDKLYTFLCVMGALVSAAFVYYECLEIHMNYVIGILTYLAVACIYPLNRQKFHKVEIEVSYEEA